MSHGDLPGPDLQYTLEPSPPHPAEAERALLLSPSWRGRLSQLSPDALQALWLEACLYARSEINRYWCWRGLDQPVLPDGFDAQAIAQAALFRLLQRETAPVPILYGLAELRHELQVHIKRRIRWLHQRSERRRLVSEWDLLPPDEDGQPVSVFDFIPATSSPPDQAILQKEKQLFLNQYKTGFETSLGPRKDLAGVFRLMWDGQKRRQVARSLGLPTSRVRLLQDQVRRRLTSFTSQATGGLAETLQALRLDPFC